tara:strand:- start:10841 stop:12064 length:1224 start_codon:yes stop_codon:yes gene_type:complete
MEKKLKDLKIQRAYKNTLGKKIGNQVWLHKDYISDLMDLTEFEKFKENLPEGYNFNILRYDEKAKEIAFIESPDFDSAHEPLVGNSIRIKKEEEGFSVSKIQTPPKDPLIYHHKWLFVKDDYKGFDISESKQRSIEWKTELGVNKSLTSKIGRLSFWNEWLKENGLKERKENNISSYLKEKVDKSKINEDIWGLYLAQDNNQEISSANTARIQIPRTVKYFQNSNLKTEGKILLDIGCGIGNERLREEIEKMGIEYNGCDPFNKPKEFNLKSIKRCMNGQADLVTLNNVLNTIKEKEIWKGILEQAKNALKDDTGILSVLIYEGEKNSKEKALEKETGQKVELTPIKTRDGWQNRMKTEEYLPVVQEVFPNSKIVSNAGIKMIVASKNPELNLEKEMKQQKNLKIKR